jgi:hypothetical protein
MVMWRDTKSLKFQAHQVGIAGEAGEPSCLLEEPVPGRTGGIEHRWVVAVQPMREEALTEIEPDALHGVQLGAAGWQRQERDVVGHDELRREVPASLVEQKDGVHAGGQLLREGGEEHGHGFGRGPR